ncbi:hypothetical protein GOODEAATRI_032986 [Goodea atripinnis]|uniref:Uncharacterized protein n=1 Tax=Goodea atripinnis TaxID=208336 RepID=A0ABV0P9Q3_9TELE
MCKYFKKSEDEAGTSSGRESQTNNAHQKPETIGLSAKRTEDKEMAKVQVQFESQGEAGDPAGTGSSGDTCRDREKIGGRNSSPAATTSFGGERLCLRRRQRKPSPQITDTVQVEGLAVQSESLSRMV